MGTTTYYNNGSPTDGTGSSVQSFVVPTGIRRLIAAVSGCRGAIVGGIGGRVDCVIPVTPGETLDLYVAGYPQGTEFTSGGRSYGHVGGWPDGGDGGPDVFISNPSLQAAGGGGGSSRIERAGTVLVQAGGGGGGAYANGWLSGGSRGGGVGVPDAGGTDLNGWNSLSVATAGNPGPPRYGSGGNPGLLLTPGTAGQSWGGVSAAAQDGDTAAVGVGGNGGRNDTDSNGDGGGGGGGRHGGGGGGTGDSGSFHTPGGGGGGGGSSYADPALVDVVYSGGGDTVFGANPWGGRIVLTWVPQGWVAVL